MNSSMTPQEAAEKLSYDSLDDIISALDAMYNSKKFMRKADYWSRCAGEAAIYLRKIAAGEYKPVVHAHWRHYKRSYIIPYDRIDEYQCSNCGSRRSIKSKYCKDCGALMDEEDKNE